MKEKAYLETNCAADREVFRVLEEVIVANSMFARNQVVARVGYARMTQPVADAEAHV
jgi:hypothetical protein